MAKKETKKATHVTHKSTHKASSPRPKLKGRGIILANSNNKKEYDRTTAHNRRVVGRAFNHLIHLGQPSQKERDKGTNLGLGIKVYPGASKKKRKALKAADNKKSANELRHEATKARKNHHPQDAKVENRLANSLNPPAKKSKSKSKVTHERAKDKPTRAEKDLQATIKTDKSRAHELHGYGKQYWLQDAELKEQRLKQLKKQSNHVKSKAKHSKAKPKTKHSKVESKAKHNKAKAKKTTYHKPKSGVSQKNLSAHKARVAHLRQQVNTYNQRAAKTTGAAHKHWAAKAAVATAAIASLHAATGSKPRTIAKGTATKKAVTSSRKVSSPKTASKLSSQTVNNRIQPDTSTNSGTTENNNADNSNSVTSATPSPVNSSTPTSADSANSINPTVSSNAALPLYVQSITAALDSNGNSRFNLNANKDLSALTNPNGSPLPGSASGMSNDLGSLVSDITNLLNQSSSRLTSANQSLAGQNLPNSNSNVSADSSYGIEKNAIRFDAQGNEVNQDGIMGDYSKYDIKHPGPDGLIGVNKDGLPFYNQNLHNFMATSSGWAPVTSISTNGVDVVSTQPEAYNSQQINKSAINQILQVNGLPSMSDRTLNQAAQTGTNIISPSDNITFMAPINQSTGQVNVNAIHPSPNTAFNVNNEHALEATNAGQSVPQNASLAPIANDGSLASSNEKSKAPINQGPQL